MLKVGLNDVDNRMSDGRRLHPFTSIGSIPVHFRNCNTVTQFSAALMTSKIRNKEGNYRREAPEVEDVDFYMLYSWEYDANKKLLSEVPGKFLLQRRKF